jgi:prepilin-type processing-associated H-X9-DG protein
VQSASELLALGDAFLRSRNPQKDGIVSFQATISPFTVFGALNPGTPAHQQPAFIAHHGRANRAFVDGHLESEDMRKPFVTSDYQLSRWNVDRQPHRDDFITDYPFVEHSPSSGRTTACTGLLDDDKITCRRPLALSQ